MSASGLSRQRATPLDPEHADDHIDRLYRAAWALCGSREDAEDLVQETYARVLSRPRLLRSENDLGYLLRALRNTFLAGERTERRRPRTEPFPAGMEPAGASSPEAEPGAREVFAVIAALPSDCRDVVVAVDVAGLSFDEAARALRIPRGTVMSRLYRARQQVARTFTSASA